MRRNERWRKKKNSKFKIKKEKSNIRRVFFREIEKKININYFVCQQKKHIHIFWCKEREKKKRFVDSTHFAFNLACKNFEFIYICDS